MRVLFIGSSSVGPRWIMSLLKKNGHQAYGIHLGYMDIQMGEPAAPFCSSINDDFILDRGINILGVTVDSLNLEKALQISRDAKERHPAIKIIWGGIHPTIMPDECINYQEVDYICIGEGEFPLLELCNALESKEPMIDCNIKNIWAKKGKKLYKNELRPYADINTLEFDRSDIYYNGIFTGRGCAGNCGFCTSPYLKNELGVRGSYFRKRSVTSVIAEISQMIKANNRYLLKQLSIHKSLRENARIAKELINYNREPIRIKDDSFLLQKNWFFEFTREFAQRFKRRGYICSARVHDITEKVADALKRGNCQLIILGFESGDEGYRNLYLNKCLTDEQIYHAVKLLRERDIPILGQWMIGMPGETPQQALKSLKMSTQIGDIPQIHIATPFPKTKMMEQAIDLGFLSADDKLPVNSVYSDFTMVPKDQINTFRLLFNAFKINNLRIAKGHHAFDRFRHDIEAKKVGDILLKDIAPV